MNAVSRATLHKCACVTASGSQRCQTGKESLESGIKNPTNLPPQIKKKGKNRKCAKLPVLSKLLKTREKQNQICQVPKYKHHHILLPLPSLDRKKKKDIKETRMPPSQAAASLLAQVPVCCASPHTSAATPLQTCPGQAVPSQIPLIPICSRPGLWGWQARGPSTGSFPWSDCAIAWAPADPGATGSCMLLFGLMSHLGPEKAPTKVEGSST